MDILDDERLKEIENEREQAKTDTTTVYDNMIGDSQKYYDNQLSAVKTNEETQKNLQQQQTNLTLEQINQQKEQSQKDFDSEKKASYIDYAKQSSKFGETAEAMASQGLSNSGVSETAKTQMYLAQQNRVASARESLSKAVLNYDNSMKEAQLANNSVLAQIAQESLSKQLEISLQSFQYKAQLQEAKQGQLNQLDSRYDTKYSNTLSQLQRQKELEESIRQWSAEFEQRVKENEQNREYQRQQLEQAKLESDRSYQLALQKASQNTIDLEDTQSNGASSGYAKNLLNVMLDSNQVFTTNTLPNRLNGLVNDGKITSEEADDIMEIMFRAGKYQPQSTNGGR